MSILELIFKLDPMFTISAVVELAIFVAIGYIIYQKVFINCNYQNGLVNDSSKEKKREVIKNEDLTKNKLLNEKSNEETNKIDTKQFLSWFENIYTIYLKAFEEKNLDIIKKSSTDNFAKKQEEKILEKAKNKINKRDIQTRKFKEITNTRIVQHKREEEKEIVVICVNYVEILNEYRAKTREEIRGLKRINNKKEYVVLERQNIKNKDEDITKTKCPKCGAPTHILTVGICSYCGSAIQNKNKEWKIADILETFELKKGEKKFVHDKYIDRKHIEEKKLYWSEEFGNWVKEIFIKSQEAWNGNKYDDLMHVETGLLYEKHTTQMKRYIKENKEEVRKNIIVYNLHPKKYEVLGDKERLTFEFKLSMERYIIDKNSGEIIEGIRDYKETYQCNLMLKKQGNKTSGTIKCDNCGAKIKVNSLGKCEYCGNIIYSDKYDWVIEDCEYLVLDNI
ncbi:MAG: hypothetical protein J6C46_06750 [Clostridia bacterium]|nr:hypothetical protein [Clostridia bacterium]